MNHTTASVLRISELKLRPDHTRQEMKQEIEWMDAQYEQMGGKTNG